MSWTSVRTAATAFVLLAALRAAGAEPPPEPWVRKITVNGAHQLSRAALLGRLDLKTWRRLPDDAGTSVPVQVAEAYGRAGLPAPTVTVSIGEPDATGATHVTLDLVETPLPRLDRLSTGYGGLPWLASFSTWLKLTYLRLESKLFRFNRKELDDVARREERRLRALGWKGAAFRIVEEPTRQGEARAVTVTLDLGPRETLERDGVDRSVMRDVASSWKKRNVPLSEGVVSRLARAAEKGMTERGYLDVHVEAAETNENGKRTIVLTAIRGPRLSVQAIRFEGAASLPERALRAAIPLHEPQLLGLSRSHPGPRDLEESRAAVVERYVRSGFPDASVEIALEGTDPRRTVVFRVAEGRRRTIGTLAFPGASAIGEPELRRITKLAEGQPYWPGRNEEAAEAVRKAYARRGYDEATVTPRPGDPDVEGRVALVFEVAEGRLFRLGEITVTGNHKTSSRKILSLGDERPGKPLDGSQLAEHQTRLSRLGIFDTVSVTSGKEPGSSPDEKSVVVRVVERPTRFVEYGLDLNTQRGLELAATLGERNLFRNAVTGSVSVLLGTERQSFVVELGQPTLFGTRLFNAVKGTYVYDRTFDGFSLQTLGAEAGFSWEFGPKRILTFIYKLEEQKPIDVQPDVEEELVPETARIGSVTPTLSLDERDDPFQTTTGWFLLARDELSREALGGHSDFDRLELDGRAYRTLGSAITLAAAVRVGYARAHGSSLLPVGERFYVGGASTHRGFREKELGPKGSDGSSLGGASYLLLNGELRAPILGPLEGGVFVDAGNAYEGRIDVTGLRWAAGLGLRLRTPVGPLRVDAGYLLDRRDGESRTVLHLALGHAF